MTPHDFVLALVALLLLAVFFIGLIATNDIDPCWPDCRTRFQDITHTIPEAL